KTPVIAFGTGTSLEGHVAALHGGVCIDLSQMNRVLRVSAEDLDCTVEAGVTRKQLNEYLRDTGLFFPIDPGADASLGGMAATRASGTNAVRYGTMPEAGVAEQVELVKAIAAEHGGDSFRWATTQEERSKLWQARHDAYYAALALRPGSQGWATDVCVPISRLAECIAETKKDLAQSTVPSAMVGHVGDGNFHLVFMIDPKKKEEIAEASRLNDRMVARALDMEGTCTGE